VVGFVGFEPRILDGSTPTRLIGEPPVGHSFQVDVVGFLLPSNLLGGLRMTLPSATDFILSQDDLSIPIQAGGSITYSLIAVVNPDGTAQLLVVAGPASTTENSAPPTKGDLRTEAAGRNWLQVADVLVRRAATGTDVFPVVVPKLPPTRCDDWQDFQMQLGGLPAIDDGTFLARAVRAYFGNGGARCYVATIRRPRFDDDAGLQDAITDLVGVAGSNEADATGLEQLLRVFEVAIVDTPDVYSRQVAPEVQTKQLPPRAVDACFRNCDDTLGMRLAIRATGEQAGAGPIFSDGAVLAAQQAMLVRCAPERWRVLLLLTSPVEQDPATGVYRGPSAPRALAWRSHLTNTVDDLSMSVAGFYHPWALTQEKIGAPTVELPPTSLAAGVIARRDIARGPCVSPANERLVGVVGLSPAVDDTINAAIYEPPVNINPLRAFPGIGVQVWGARTLSGDEWMRYLVVRRCLSAIERSALVALQPLVFEPNTPTLWFQITQAMLGVLSPIFASGGLRGDTPEQAYYVRCDASNNPPEAIEVGQVLCEVGVAIAAPAEFIVFRVGRSEGVVEILE
jgi:phage tail sheath protein FI